MYSQGLLIATADGSRTLAIHCATQQALSVGAAPSMGKLMVDSILSCVVLTIPLKMVWYY